jgi:hypothetical protein
MWRGLVPGSLDGRVVKTVADSRGSRMTVANEYGHRLPTEEDVLLNLGELVGTDVAEGLWEIAVRKLGLTRPVSDADDLRLMAEQLMSVGELARVVGRSLKVRLVTFEALAREEKLAREENRTREETRTREVTAP